MDRRIAPIAIAVALVVVALGLQLWVASRSGDVAAPTDPPPTPSIRCVAEAGLMPSFLASDPCPGAITAVELAVAPVRLPIERIVIEPGPFYCDVIWPSQSAPPRCYGILVVPGQFMHAWVSFTDTNKIAAVMLGLDFSTDAGQPDATRPPWKATLVATEIPPDGWVMP